MLQALNICQQFEGQEKLHALSLSVKKGEITALIGPSGAGKTTVLQSLAMIVPPRAGEIVLDGQRFVFPSQEPIAALPWPKISVVFQQLFLWPHLTLRQNISLPLAKGVWPADDRELAELAERFKLNESLDRYPNQVSLGQRQRAALLRAHAVRPEYLLLDEVTSSLDIEQTDVLASYLEAMKKKGVGILLVTHLLGLARRLADTVIFLENGSVLESGGPEVLQHPRHPRVREFIALA